jgi:hypothetical protein
MLHDPQAAAGGRGVIAVAGQLKIVIARSGRSCFDSR